MVGGEKPLTTIVEHAQTYLETCVWAEANKRAGTVGGGLEIKESSCGVCAEIPAQSNSWVCRLSMV